MANSNHACVKRIPIERTATQTPEAGIRQRRGRIWTGFRVLLTASVLVQVFIPDPHRQANQVFAQAGQPVDRDPVPGFDPDAVLELIFPVERQVAQQVRQARVLISEGRYAEGVGILGGILEGDEDHYLPLERNQFAARSAKSEAMQVLADLPQSARDLLEIQLGAAAARRLEEGITSRDLNVIEGVARRYPMTRAGNDATWLLARRALEQGHVRLAQTYLDRLWHSPACSAESPAESPLGPLSGIFLAITYAQSGKPDVASAVLSEAKARFGHRKLSLQGKSLEWFDGDDQALSWLERLAGGAKFSTGPFRSADWTMYRGGPDRNAVAQGGTFLMTPRWRVRTGNSPLVQDTLAKMSRAFVEAGQAVGTAIQPIAVGNVLVTRTADRLIALDLETGKRVWEVEPLEDDVFEPLARADRADAGTNADGIDLTSQLVGGLEQRLWDDYAFGCLASDGERVYSLEGLDFALTESVYRPRVIAPNGEEMLDESSPSNRLAARELATEGKLVWEVGGESGGDERALAGAFFLGSPLVLDDSLYVLFERQNEVRLAVLEAATGRLLWSQALALVEDNVGLDGVRRLAGASPAYDAGVLVCPTASGAVVALDLTSRSIRWGVPFPRDAIPVRRMSRALQPSQGDGSEGARQAWGEASPTIAGGHVLLTPSEFPALLCLNLFDGRQMWRLEIADRLYVACVHADVAVLACANRVEGLRLSDGAQVWELRLQEGESPSGRGFYAAPYYYLPLTSGEVAQIHLDSGSIVRRIPSRTGGIPGNLICFGDQVASQGTTHIELFYQLEPLKARVEQTLAVSPDDPWALSRRGQIAWEEGRLDNAIEDFRRAYQVYNDRLKAVGGVPSENQPGADAPPEETSSVNWKLLLRDDVLPDFAGLLETRGLLVSSILDGLDRDFAAHAGELEELSALSPSDEERAAALRLASRGWQTLGESEKAIGALAGTVAPAEETPPLEPAGHQWDVRADRWFRGRLRDLMAKPAPETVMPPLALSALAQREFVAAQGRDDIRSWRHFLDYFGDLPLADEAAFRLVELLVADDYRLESESLLRGLLLSPREESQRRAMARLALLYHDWRRIELSAELFQELARRWSDVPVWNGKTPQALIADLGETSPVVRRLNGARWPTGRVDAERQRTVQRENLVPVRVVPTLHGSPGLAPWCGLMFEPNQGELIARDEFGRALWNVRTRGGQNYMRSRMPRGVEMSAHAKGHLLLVSVGDKIVAIDGFFDAIFERPVPENTSLPIRWSHDLDPPWMDGRFRARGVAGAAVGPFGGPESPAIGNPMEPAILSLGVGAFYQRDRSLYCVDPLSGRILWRRGGVPAGSRLYGDEEVVIAAPRDSTEGRVYRAIDGFDLGTCELPPEREIWHALGRHLLTWRRQPRDIVELKLADPWRGSEIWSREYPAAARADFLGIDELALLNPDGSFQLIGLADGSTRMETNLVGMPTGLAALRVFPEADRLFVVVAEKASLRGEPRQLPDGTTISVGPLPPLSPGRGSPLVTGRLHSLDRHTGQSLWPEPAQLEDVGLVQEQLEQSPVIVFAHHTQRAIPRSRTIPRARSGLSATQTASLVCFDKQSGRVVHRDDNLSPGTPASTSPRIELAPEESKVRVTMPGNIVVLHYTNEPWPAGGAPGTSPSWSGFSQGLRGFFEIFRGPPSESPLDDLAPGDTDVEIPVPAADEGDIQFEFEPDEDD